MENVSQEQSGEQMSLLMNPVTSEAYMRIKQRQQLNYPSINNSTATQ